MTQETFVLILWTAPTLAEAKKVATELLTSKQIACATLMPCDSLFVWEGKMEEVKEIQLLFKTRRSCFDEVKKTILSITSYEVPEILMIPIEEGHLPYLQWIQQNTQSI